MQDWLQVELKKWMEQCKDTQAPGWGWGLGPKGLLLTCSPKMETTGGYRKIKEERQSRGEICRDGRNGEKEQEDVLEQW